MAFERAIDDDEGIILTGVLVSDTNVMNDIMRAAGPDRSLRMARAAAAGKPEVLAALVSLLNRIDPELARPAVAELLGHPDVDVVVHVLEVATAEGVVGELLEVSAVLDGEARARLASLEAWATDRPRSRVLGTREPA